LLNLVVRKETARLLKVKRLARKEADVHVMNVGKGKENVHPRTGYEGPDRNIFLLFL
jgi:hypothetical protein